MKMFGFTHGEPTCRPSLNTVCGFTTQEQEWYYQRLLVQLALIILMFTIGLDRQTKSTWYPGHYIQILNRANVLKETVYRVWNSDNLLITDTSVRQLCHQAEMLKQEIGKSYKGFLSLWTSVVVFASSCLKQRTWMLEPLHLHFIVKPVARFLTSISGEGTYNHGNDTPIRQALGKTTQHPAICKKFGFKVSDRENNKSGTETKPIITYSNRKKSVEMHNMSITPESKQNKWEK